MAKEVLHQGQVKSDLKYSSTKSRRSSSKSTVQSNVGPVKTLDASSIEVKFPKIGECAHFHYETVDYGQLFISLLDEPVNGITMITTDEFYYGVRVLCKGKSWVIHRNLKQFTTLDETIHECVYERRFTRLTVLKNLLNKHSTYELVQETLQKYVMRLSELPENQISCAPALHWLELNNKGRNLVGGISDDAAINIPAVAAGHVVRRYTAQAEDELSLEVGDMVSVIDMSDPNWWRGKCRLMVGSFPSQCIKRIADAKEAEQAVPKPQSSENLLTTSSISKSNTTSAAAANRNKPIMKKHGKFMDFLRSFLDSRPTKAQLKKSGILKERVFGCDLGEYLHNFKHDIPPVLMDCIDFIEKHGILDGIYRISGVASHVQQLRHEYDSENIPDLENWRGEYGVCDPHSVAGLCKLYFRELPNPLLTYQLYDKFAEAAQSDMQQRLLHFHDVIQQLPPPHYRTVKHLMLHLNFMAKHEAQTSMHCRNLAIVWAPNLLRSREIEAGIAAFTEARVQSVVTEFLISNADILFSEKLQSIRFNGANSPRPKSLMVMSAPKLISLEEAQARSKNRGKFVRSISTSDAPNDNSEFNNVVVERRENEEKVLEINEDDLKQSSTVKEGRRKSADNQVASTSGWKNKFISSFTRRNYLRAKSIPEDVNNDADTVILRRSWSDDSMLSSHNSSHDVTFTETIDETTESNERRPYLRTTSQSLRPSPSRTARPRGHVYIEVKKTKSESSEPEAPDNNNVGPLTLGIKEATTFINQPSAEDNATQNNARKLSIPIPPDNKENINIAASVDVKNICENENNNNKTTIKGLWKKVGENNQKVNEVKRSRAKSASTSQTTYYWKNEDIDLPKPTFLPSPLDVPDENISDYTIHYTPTNQVRNGRTHRSFRATFVKDRQKMDKETPHTIVRSYDVPPQMIRETDKMRQIQRMSISRRSKTTSEGDPASELLIHQYHDRSLSANDELLITTKDTKPIAKRRHKPPVPKPRSNHSRPDVVTSFKQNVPLRKPKQTDWQETSLNVPEDNCSDKSSNTTRIIRRLSAAKHNTVNNNIMPPNNDVISHTVLSWV